MKIEDELAMVLPLGSVGRDDLPRVGGKGANLGILVGAGLRVPPGFCVTTAAFDLFMAQDPKVVAMLEALDELPPDAVQRVRDHAGRLREHLCGMPVPAEVREPVLAAWREAGVEHAYAVRSSATLEDLPEASFAGQQDTYLEVRGAEDIEARLRSCWASLFTDRAILYRRQYGFRSNTARLAVVVQRMVRPEVSGILFSADPVTGHRGISSIDASYGLGEALVSGLVDADLYRLERATGALVELRVGDKAIAIHAKAEGGTETRPVPRADRERRCLDDAQLAALLELAEQVEQLQGCPQDLEWCFEAGVLYLVQARPITSLFPLPEPISDRGGLRVYMSFGHVQVNTAAMPPMAHAVARYLQPLSGMVVSAGGRIFLDMTALLLRWPLSKFVPVALMDIDPGIARRLQVIRDRPEFRSKGAGPALSRWAMARFLLSAIPRVLHRFVWSRPQRASQGYQNAIEAVAIRYEESFARAEVGGPRLREATRALTELMPGPLFDTHFPILVAGMISWRLLERVMRGRVPEGTVEALSRGLPGNVTTEMDLELGDLADRAREVPALVEHLRSASPRTAIDSARSIEGAGSFLAAWDGFIERYGHRGPGEIDISVVRWAEDPSSLVTSLVGIIGDDPGAHRRRHEVAIGEAERAEAKICEAARGGLWGWFRVGLARRLILRMRTFLGLREHGKFLAMHLFMHARLAIESAAAIALERGSLQRKDDAWLLDFEELTAVLEGGGPSLGEIDRRRAMELRYAKMVPPRVMTSEGEQPTLPDLVGPLARGELAGLAASAGTVEGIARVVLDPAKEVLVAGEILVAPFTDPGWTPLFVHAGGVVTEVGGLMTHGSVVAREYGLPAVVGVDGATRRIKTGQRIRVDGDRGRVMLLDECDEGDTEEAAQEVQR